MSLIDNPDFEPMIEGWNYTETRNDMEAITVNKIKLLDTLQRNRAEHREIFLKAQDVYREAMIVELDQALQDARDGKQIVRAFRLPVPEDHTEDFDTAIEMLNWEQRDSIALSHRDFQTFVQNQWGWQASFAANTASYLVE